MWHHSKRVNRASGLSIIIILGMGKGVVELGGHFTEELKKSWVGDRSLRLSQGSLLMGPGYACRMEAGGGGGAV